MTARKNRKPHYEVGRGKPPKAGQFKPGRSGNPRGRPKKVVRTHTADQVETDVLRLLEREIHLTAGGKRKIVTMIEAILAKMGEKALQGHAPSQRYLVNFATKAGANFEKKQADALKALDEHEASHRIYPAAKRRPFYRGFGDELRERLRRFGKPRKRRS